jgi:hypothetical protein
MNTVLSSSCRGSRWWWWVSVSSGEGGLKEVARVLKEAGGRGGGKCDLPLALLPGINEESHSFLVFDYFQCHIFCNLKSLTSSHQERAIDELQVYKESNISGKTCIFQLGGRDNFESLT